MAAVLKKTFSSMKKNAFLLKFDFNIIQVSNLQRSITVPDSSLSPNKPQIILSERWFGVLTHICVKSVSIRLRLRAFYEGTNDLRLSLPILNIQLKTITHPNQQQMGFVEYFALSDQFPFLWHKLNKIKHPYVQNTRSSLVQTFV